MAAVCTSFYIRKVSCFEKTKYAKRCTVKSSTTWVQSLSYSSTFLSSKRSQHRHIKFWPCENDFLFFLFHLLITPYDSFKKKQNRPSDAAWKILQSTLDQVFLRRAFCVQKDQCFERSRWDEMKKWFLSTRTKLFFGYLSSKIFYVKKMKMCWMIQRKKSYNRKSITYFTYAPLFWGFIQSWKRMCLCR